MTTVSVCLLHWAPFAPDAPIDQLEADSYKQTVGDNPMDIWRQVGPAETSHPARSDRIADADRPGPVSGGDTPATLALPGRCGDDSAHAR